MALELQNVSKVFPGQVVAMDRLSLRVDDGELVVLAGPSGCGKSTTLRVIAGLEPSDSGEVLLDGRSIGHLPPADRNVAMVFQNHALYPHLSVRSNLAFGLKVKGTPRDKIEKIVARAGEMLGLSEVMQRKPAALSGGQRQRVALGRAIVREPAVFLLDEPLSSLDAPLRVTLRGQIRQLQRSLGVAMVYVTHDQEEAMSLADRLVIMKDGRLLQSGQPLEIYRRPVNQFVAGFLGARRMNFLQGVIRAGEGSMLFEEGVVDAGGRLTLPGNGFTLCIPPVPGLASDARAGRHVVLGIRPEHLRIKPEAAETTFKLRGRVQLVEPLGSLVDVETVTDLKNGLIARLDAREGSVTGPEVELYGDWREVCFFEPGVTGMNLSLSNESAHAIA